MQIQTDLFRESTLSLISHPHTGEITHAYFFQVECSVVIHYQLYFRSITGKIEYIQQNRMFNHGEEQK